MQYRKSYSCFYVDSVKPRAPSGHAQKEKREWETVTQHVYIYIYIYIYIKRERGGADMHNTHTQTHTYIYKCCERKRERVREWEREREKERERERRCCYERIETVTHTWTHRLYVGVIANVCLYLWKNVWVCTLFERWLHEVLIHEHNVRKRDIKSNEIILRHRSISEHNDESIL